MSNIPGIPPDKAQHFCWGAIAGAAGRQLAPLVGLDPLLGAFTASFVGGVIKEGMDLRAGGRFSFQDLLATVLGCVPSLQGA